VVTLNGASSYTGNTTLSAGSFILAVASTSTTVGPFGGGTVTLSNSNLRADNTARTVSNSMVIANTTYTFGDTAGTATGTLTFAGGNTFNASTVNVSTTAVIFSGGSTFAAGSTTVFNGNAPITLSGGFNLNGGNNTLTFNN